MDRSTSASTDREPPTGRAWHAIGGDAAVEGMGSSASGLTADEARDRLERHGPNRLPAAKGRSLAARILAQFNNLLIYVLLGAAVIAAFLGHAVDTAVILGVVVINALIGFIQEGRAEKALAAIQNMISPRAVVIRDGRRVTVEAADVAPGDILVLEPGSRVPADARLVSARNLRIDEAVLTGESVPSEKSVDPVDEAAMLGDRRSMAYSGTLVTAGLGTGVVVATGGATELGRISALLSTVVQLETPLIRQMNHFARQLTAITLTLAAATFAFASLVRGYELAESFMIVVGMAVAAIPEGLPAVMTITMAIGVQRMASRNVIIRRLPAVETLGSVSTICTDKTGTLTRNEMTVTRVVLAEATIEVGGVGYAPVGGFRMDQREIDPTSNGDLVDLARIAMLCNDSSLQQRDGEWRIEGDPMEAALVVLGLKAGFQQDSMAKELPRRDVIPFDAAHRYMATLHRSHSGQVLAYVKGAPERLLEMCESEAAGGSERPLDRSYWQAAAEKLAAGGHRVLALAMRPLPSDHRDLGLGDVEHGLTLVGLVGLIDPPREDAVAAVAECHTAGIAVRMITGDHAMTASAIAADIGLQSPDAVVTGAELDRWDDEELRRRAKTTTVFARTSPEHKLRLVQALQADGSVIAMTGDGVNDASALKRADVGVAMGATGTEAAKEASEMVIADDNFASIVAAVREGRTVYDNLTKVISWQLPVNGGESMILIAAIALGLTLPVTPVQILWINMVTAVGLGLVLAFEPPEANIMQRPPRQPDAPLLSGLVIWRVALVSVLVAIGAFSMFAWAKIQGAPIEYARTMVVNTVVAMEIFYLFSVRFLHSTSLTWRGVLGTPPVLLGVGGIILVQTAFTYAPPMQMLLGTAPLSFVDLVTVTMVGVILLVILEIEKRVRPLVVDAVSGARR